MSGRKVSQLHFYWIAFMTGVWTFYHSVCVILGSYFAKNKRAYVDKQLYTWSKRLLDLVKVRVNTIGLEKIPKSANRPIVVMCNHFSLYDIPVSAVALNTSLRMMAKKELYSIPVFSSALRRGEFVSIDRHNREQALKDLKVAKQKMQEGIILWVAPEGTRSKNGKLQPFKRGAFHVAIDTKALIVPVVIKNVHHLQSGKDLTLTIDQQIDVEICDPVDAAEYNIETRAKLVQAVRAQMVNVLEQADDPVITGVNNEAVA